jgi:sugar phosphate isomerase/epimerase
MLRTAAGAAAAAGLGLALPGNAVAAGGGRRVPKQMISIQLYTLRDALQADLEGTLAALADIGYRTVELAGTYGRSATEFRRLLDRYGLRATSAHVGFDGADIDQLIADAKVLGYHMADCAWAKFDTLEQWTAFADRLDRAGEAFRKAGIRYGYHNHNHEWQAIDGVRPIDVLTARTDPRNIHFEFDLYWVIKGGADPVAEFRRRQGRVLQYHVKDMAADGGFADLGHGTIDFGRLFARTWNGPMKQYVVENDQPEDALVCAQRGFDYLSTLRF